MLKNNYIFHSTHQSNGSGGGDGALVQVGQVNTHDHHWIQGGKNDVTVTYKNLIKTPKLKTFKNLT